MFDNNFADDAEKMLDFLEIDKEMFLKSYSYLTEEEYEDTENLYRLAIDIKRNYPHLEKTSRVKIMNMVGDEIIVFQDNEDLVEWLYLDIDGLTEVVREYLNTRITEDMVGKSFVDTLIDRDSRIKYINGFYVFVYM